MKSFLLFFIVFLGLGNPSAHASEELNNHNWSVQDTFERLRTSSQLGRELCDFAIKNKLEFKVLTPEIKKKYNYEDIKEGDTTTRTIGFYFQGIVYLELSYMKNGQLQYNTNLRKITALAHEISHAVFYKDLMESKRKTRPFGIVINAFSLSSIAKNSYPYRWLMDEFYDELVKKKYKTDFYKLGQERFAKLVQNEIEKSLMSQ